MQTVLKTGHVTEVEFEHSSSLQTWHCSDSAEETTSYDKAFYLLQFFSCMHTDIGLTQSTRTEHKAGLECLLDIIKSSFFVTNSISLVHTMDLNHSCSYKITICWLSFIIIIIISMKWVFISSSVHCLASHWTSSLLYISVLFDHTSNFQSIKILQLLNIQHCGLKQLKKKVSKHELNLTKRVKEVTSVDQSTD